MNDNGMADLYASMPAPRQEQRMIEQLAEHGVTAMDLVPSLVTTLTVANPEYDPEAAREAAEEAASEAREREEVEREKKREREELVPEIAVEPDHSDDDQAGDLAAAARDLRLDRPASGPRSPTTPKAQRRQTSPPLSGPSSPTARAGDDGQDIGHQPPSPRTPRVTAKSPTDGRAGGAAEASTGPTSPVTPTVKSNLVEPLPSSLPGVSQNLSAADKTITLDIRWTILCDLFLALIADSVYDARSRVLLGRLADQLGLSWMDVVRFERRLTEALELQEGIDSSKKGNEDALLTRAKADKKRRYVMMGLATVGGGLVLGLSAGLLAPAIGAGIAGALATAGVSGGTAFLGGAGGAAVITTTGVMTGSSIGGRGMARRTKAVTKFEFHPLHNNKRLNAIITVPG